MQPTVPLNKLTTLYQRGHSCHAIAKRFGLTLQAVTQRFKRHGVLIRPYRPQGKRLNIPSQELATLYDAGYSTPALAKKFSVSTSAIVGRLKRIGHPFRPASTRTRKEGSDHGRWRGGRWANVNGYVFLYMGAGQRPRQEHRVVMERILGRSLKSHEVVHHINGIRNDNRPENLVLTTPKKHESRTFIKALQRRICYLETLLKEHDAHSPKERIDFSGTMPSE